MTYDATSIRILQPDEADEMFIWNKAQSLSEEYPTVALGSILKGLEACSLSGMADDLYIQRYLQGDRTVEVTSEFTAAYSNLVQVERDKLRNK